MVATLPQPLQPSPTPRSLGAFPSELPVFPSTSYRSRRQASGAVAVLRRASARAAAQCPAGAEDLRLGSTLPRVKAAIGVHQRVVIVALGSSSTQGHGVTVGTNAYPAQAQVTLTHRFETVHVTFVMLNRGVGGQVVTEMVARLERDVLSHHPDLVIWQAGTNAAMRGMDVETFRLELRAGIDRLKAAGADVVLMTPQYVPAVIALPNEEDYVAAMHAVAAEKGVGVFRRFDIMRHWVMQEHMPFARFIIADGLHLNDFGQRCTGQLLARAVEGALHARLSHR
jgi:acyl-CoA thioesterase I